MWFLCDRWSRGAAAGSAFLFVCCACGCLPPAGDAAPSEGDSAREEIPRASVTLRVAVVNDEPLRKAIDRLQGEWNALTDGGYETFDVDPGGAVEGDPPADLVVFPSHLLGELCDAGRLRPVRDSVLRMETLALAELLPVVRQHEMIYGQRAMALPLGCAAPLWLRPETGGGIDPPEEDASLALAYLAWAAPHVVHRSRKATLFDRDTMAPRLTEPPFQRALDLFADRCEQGGGSIVWPRRQGGPLPEAPLTVSPPPAAEEVFNPFAQQWEPIGSGPGGATLVGSRGRLLAATTEGRNAATAFRLAAWLAGAENAATLSTASDGVAPCRIALVRKGDDWLGSGDPGLALRLAEAHADSFRSHRALFAPRLPGAERYLSALGGAIRSRLTGGATTEEALTRASEAWDVLTDQLGRNRQREAYLRSINTAEMPL